jgi:hypothetical protein
MRDVLSDIVKHSYGLFDVIKIIGSEKETTLLAKDKKQVQFLSGTIKVPAPELRGEFGISNLGLLKGLLDFPSYRSESASLTVKHRPWSGGETVEHFEFRDGKGGRAVMRCMSPDQVAGSGLAANINWTVSVVPSKSKVAEFQQMSSLISEVDKTFGAFIQDGNLIFSFGQDTSSTHYATVVFAEGVDAPDGALTPGYSWEVGPFLQTLKLSAEDATVRVSARGIISTEIETEIGVYRYYLRASR